MSQFTDAVVFITSDLPTQHIQCVLREEALTGNKRFVVVLHKAIKQSSYYKCTLYVSYAYIYRKLPTISGEKFQEKSFAFVVL